MSAGHYVIRKVCVDGTRSSFWVGICQVTGHSAWSRDSAAATRFAEPAAALAFLAACYQVGVGRREQYEVIDLRTMGAGIPIERGPAAPRSSGCALPAQSARRGLDGIP